MTPCCDAQYTCQWCARTICADERPSPGEPFQCDDCHDSERALTEAIRNEPPSDYSWSAA